MTKVLKNTKAQVKTAKAEKKVEAKTEKKESIGAFTKTLILAGKSVKEIEKMIKAKFPTCGPQVNSIYFYRSKLIRSGQLKRA